MNRRITTEHPLHDESGNLIEVGYATEPLFSYNRRHISASKFHIKEWDYYCVGKILTEFSGYSLPVDGR